jgi:hypothetical protein
VTQEDFLLWLARALQNAAIPYMIAGSFGSSFHGQPRASNDVDVVIDPTPEQLERLLALFTGPYYVNPQAAREALRCRSMFNVIDLTEGWKADLIVRKDRPFSTEEFRRRQMWTLRGQALPVVSPEDVILTKLEWDTISPSERQRQDALSVALVQGPKLDRDYLRKWAPVLGLSERVEELLQEADSIGPPGAV